MSHSPAWLNSSPLQQFFAAVDLSGGVLRAVGGAVRDHVLKRSVGDVDFATTLLPEAIMEIADEQGWKTVPTGIAHGTVTVVIDHVGYEVTTLRRDVSTDGRRASVAYTDSWAEDAARRDFTINALYMDAAGILHDPTGQGMEDIAAQRLRFIGDADERIREDGLRILRYFRFLAQLAWQADAAAVAACARHVGMIEQLSGERIQQEMKKLLAAADPQHALQHMALIGIDALLTQSVWRPDVSFIAPEDLPGEALPWVRLLQAIAPDARAVAGRYVIERWRLGHHDRDMLQYLLQPCDAPDAAFVKEARYRGIKTVWMQARLALYASDHAVDVAALIALSHAWQPPKLPVSAKDLLARGMVEGPELGKALRQLEQRWIGSDYTLTREALLDG